MNGNQIGFCLTLFLFWVVYPLFGDLVFEASYRIGFWFFFLVVMYFLSLVAYSSQNILLHLLIACLSGLFASFFTDYKTPSLNYLYFPISYFATFLFFLAKRGILGDWPLSLLGGSALSGSAFFALPMLGLCDPIVVEKVHGNEFRVHASHPLMSSLLRSIAVVPREGSETFHASSDTVSLSGVFHYSVSSGDDAMEYWRLAGLDRIVRQEFFDNFLRNRGAPWDTERLRRDLAREIAETLRDTPCVLLGLSIQLHLQ